MTDTTTTPTPTPTPTPPAQPTPTPTPTPPAAVTPAYGEKLGELDAAQLEEKEVKEKQGFLEKTLKNSMSTVRSVETFLEKTQHPKGAEYTEVLKTIKTGDYPVQEENAHYTFLAAKLFLNDKNLPDSAVKDFEVLKNSTGYTPSIKNELSALKPFLELEMDKQNKTFMKSDLREKLGGVRGDLNTFTDVLRNYDTGKLTCKEFLDLKKEYLDGSRGRREASRG